MQKGTNACFASADFGEKADALPTKPTNPQTGEGMTPKPKLQPQDQEIQEPAKITELHVLGRPALNDDMKEILGRQAWSVSTKFVTVAMRGQLDGGRRERADRLRAGLEYAKAVAQAQPGSTDSSQKLNASRSTGGHTGAETRSHAARKVSLVEQNLGRGRPGSLSANFQIIRMVFENDEWPAEAVKQVTGDYEDARPSRFREAVDALIDAMAAANSELRRKRVGGNAL